MICNSKWRQSPKRKSLHKLNVHQTLPPSNFLLEKNKTTPLTHRHELVIKVFRHAQFLTKRCQRKRCRPIEVNSAQFSIKCCQLSEFSIAQFSVKCCQPGEVTDAQFSTKCCQLGKISTAQFSAKCCQPSEVNNAQLSKSCQLREINNAQKDRLNSQRCHQYSAASKLHYSI